MKLLALLLLLTLIGTPPTEAKRHHRVTVCDMVGGSWSDPVAETVNAFRTAVPSLRYTAGTCPKGSIRLQIGTPPGAYVADRVILTSTTDLDPIDVRRFVCHELMHVLTGIGDNYGAEPDSCVWGTLDHPGAFDIAQLQARRS